MFHSSTSFSMDLGCPLLRGSFVRRLCRRAATAPTISSMYNLKSFRKDDKFSFLFCNDGNYLETLWQKWKWQPRIFKSLLYSLTHSCSISFPIFFLTIAKSSTTVQFDKFNVKNEEMQEHRRKKEPTGFNNLLIPRITHIKTPMFSHHFHWNKFNWPNID